MKIKPKKSDYKKWLSHIPCDGDLLFCPKPGDLKHFKSLGARIHASSRKHPLWSLSRRSWYAYAMNRSSHFLWLPRGKIETFDKKLRDKIARLQNKLEVPTVIWNKKTKSSLWITAEAWGKSARGKKLALLHAWVKQNEIHFYDSASYARLPAPARRTLQKKKLRKILHTYAAISGPNCLATAAMAATGKTKIGNLWLHPGPFTKILRKQGYRNAPGQKPRAGDVLVFSRKKQIVHAAYCLDEQFYFEKPGQDFYEPYRITRFKNWKKEWPRAELRILRR
jgi:hypothetical protein